MLGVLLCPFGTAADTSSDILRANVLHSLSASALPSRRRAVDERALLLMLLIALESEGIVASAVAASAARRSVRSLLALD